MADDGEDVVGEAVAGDGEADEGGGGHEEAGEDHGPAEAEGGHEVDQGEEEQDRHQGAVVAQEGDQGVGPAGGPVQDHSHLLCQGGNPS